MKLRYSPWALAVLLSADAVSSDSSPADRRESAQKRWTSQRKPNRPIALGEAFADGLDVEVYAREYDRLMTIRRLKTTDANFDEEDNAAAAAAVGGLRSAGGGVTSAADDAQQSALDTAGTYMYGAAPGPVQSLVNRAVARANRASADAAASGAANGELRSGEKRSLHDLGNGRTIDLDDSYDDVDQHEQSTSNLNGAKTATADDLVDAMIAPPRIPPLSETNADTSSSSSSLLSNNDRPSVRDKLLLEQRGGGRGESIHHRISDGGTTTPRPISHLYRPEDTSTTTVLPDGGVQNDLESTFERKCSTITSLNDLKKAIDDASYWSNLVGPAMVRLCPFHVAVDDDAEGSSSAPLSVNSAGLTIVCDKSDNLHLSQPYMARPRNRIPSNVVDYLRTSPGEEDDSNSCVIEGSGHHLTISADYVTVMGMDFRGSTEIAVSVSSAVKGTSIVGCTFDGNDVSVPPPIPIISEEILIEEGVEVPGDHGNRDGPNHHEHEASSGKAGAALNLGADTTGTLVASSTFSHNVAAMGGAIAAVDSELSVYDSLFTSNRATDGDGGAILMNGEDDFSNILHVTQSSWMFNSIAEYHDERSEEAMDDDHHHHYHGPIIYSDGFVCDAGSNFACKNGESAKSHTDGGSGFADFDTMFTAECNGLSTHDTACQRFGHICEASLGGVRANDENLREDLPDWALEFGGGGGEPYSYESNSGVTRVGTGSGGNSFPGPSSGGDMNRVNQVPSDPTFMPTKVPTVPPTLAPTSPAPTTPSPTKRMVCGGEMDVETREILLRLIITAITDLDDLIPTGIDFTPQWQAFRWIVDEDEMQLCPGIDMPSKIQQRYTAAVLYFSTGGDKWTRCSRYSTSPCIVGGHFLGSNSECLWYGVSCNLSGQIFRIDFEDNNLVGSIASELGSLVELTSLALEKGDLEGIIPSTLGQLSKLETLDLDYNRLTGDIPPEIVNAQALRLIDLNDNKLSGGLQYLSQLNNLERLWIHSNVLVGPVPSSFGNIPRLCKYKMMRSTAYSTHLLRRTKPLPDFCPIFFVTFSLIIYFSFFFFFISLDKRSNAVALSQLIDWHNTIIDLFASVSQWTSPTFGS